MATLITVAIPTILAGVGLGALLKLSFAIRREDRNRGSLRFDAPDRSAQSARALVGITSSRWD
jgi:hypothetical protein